MFNGANLLRGLAVIKPEYVLIQKMNNWWLEDKVERHCSGVCNGKDPEPTITAFCFLSTFRCEQLFSISFGTLSTQDSSSITIATVVVRCSPFWIPMTVFMWTRYEPKSW